MKEPRGGPGAPDPYSQAARRYFGPDYRSQPAEWVRDHLGEYMTDQQRLVINSLKDNRYTVVPASHDVGKSFTASRAVGWWLDTHPVGEAFVVSTAPTATQVSAILWREIGKAHRKGGLRGKINKGMVPQWLIDGELVGYGRKPKDYDPSAFQGIHARYVLVIIDEACGVNQELFNAVDSLATNIHARVLAIGNPDDPASYFATICKPGSGWNVVQLDGLRSANFTEEMVREFPELYEYMVANEIPFSTEPVPEDVREMLISPLWVYERIKRWGIGSSLWQSKVRGQFPDNTTEGVIPLGWVTEAIKRWQDWDDGGRAEPSGHKVFGVDVAREGDDYSVIATRQGHVIHAIDTYTGSSTMVTANRVAKRVQETKKGLAVVDVIGIGSGVVDRLREMGVAVNAFNAANKSFSYDSTGVFAFSNLRAEAWWGMRELLDPSKGSVVCLPPDDELVADLTCPKWKVSPGNPGRIVIESKDEIRKRLGRSTDRADAVIQAFTAEAAAAGGSGAEIFEWATEDAEYPYDPQAHEGVYEWAI